MHGCLSLAAGVLIVVPVQVVETDQKTDQDHHEHRHEDDKILPAEDVTESEMCDWS